MDTLNNSIENSGASYKENIHPSFLTGALSRIENNSQ